MNKLIVDFCELINNVIHSNNYKTLKDDIEWDAMVRLAKEHNLLAILVEEAVKYPTYVSRKESKKEMSETMAIVSAQIRRTNTFLKLYEEFVKADIHPIVVKGLICRKLYGDLEDHRPSGDEDIVISLSDYWKVKSIMVKNGYTTDLEKESVELLEQLQEIDFIHKMDRMHIEVHINPMGRETDARSRMSDYFINANSDVRVVEINGIPIHTMNHRDFLLFLILHALRHFTSGGFGIRQALDILLYQEKYGESIDMKELWSLLVEFKAHIFWSDIIHIGNTMLGFELPTMQAPNCPQELLEDMVLSGTFGNHTEAQRAAARATEFSTGNYLKTKSHGYKYNMLKAIFPSKMQLLKQFPYLEEKPWLLPIEWIKRWGRFIKRNRRIEGNLAVESFKISQRRRNVLEKYDLI